MKKILSGILFFLIALIVLLPTLLPTQWIVNGINGNLRGKIAVNQLKLSWFGGQEAVGVTYFSPRGEVEFHAAHIQADLSILALIKGLTKQIPQLKIKAENYTLFQKMIAGKDPLVIELNVVDIPNHTIDSGKISIGKVLFSESRRISSIVRLLKLDSKENILVWATPIYFAMKEGKIAVKRFDFLVANSMPMALWGKINLNKGKIYFTLALEEKLLEKSIPFVKGNGLAQIPLKGSTQSIKIDEGGALVNLGKKFLGQNRLPPPTTQPFPWHK